MLQKQKNQKSLILELDYEAEYKSIMSSTKMAEQKIISKFVDLYEEVLVQIKGSQNLYLINKMANFKSGNVFNIDVLQSNFKYLITLLIQELIQFQRQVDSQNVEPNKSNNLELNQIKLDLQKFKNDNTDLQYKIKELEQQIHQQKQLNTTICQDLFEARQKYQELQKKYNQETQIKQSKSFHTFYDQNIKEKLKKLHTIYQIDKCLNNKSIINKKQKLTIMTEPCDSDSQYSRYSTIIQQNNSQNDKTNSRNKQNQTIETVTSVGTENNQMSDSSSCLLSSSFYKRREKSNTLSFEQSQEWYQNIKPASHQGLPLNSKKQIIQTQFSRQL
ncbi:unnamed protein product [Paramecium octaurelia]|uniref:Uncharacterized protein n=1 Tax=Paramecium octaurelia TaxID=43137 RepID=A0A8S1TQT5_PAROT|nr:unnamed protein product [Paramecium octaurelia]